MSDIEEAFKLKAQELLKLVSGSSVPPAKIEEVRKLFNEAKAVYEAGRPDEALILVVQAIKKVKSP